MIKGIVFDFDGLIIDTESLWYSAFNEVLQDYGMELPVEVFAQCVGTSDEALHAFIEEKLGAESIETIVKLARENHSLKTEQLEIRDGVKEYLTEAKTAGLQIGLASSSHREWVEGFLKKLGIRDYFSVIKTGDEVERIKPDPTLYLLAIEALGVAPQEAVAFEDSPNGARAATAAGLHCVIVPNESTKDLPFDKYSMRLESMAEVSLSEVIRQLEQTPAHKLDPNMSTDQEQRGDIEWHSPLEAPFRVSGLAWFGQEKLYRRLPLHPVEEIRPAVDSLANCTSGAQIGFRTNSKTVSVRVTLNGSAGMYHMPPTGECGVDAYIGRAGAWLHAGTARFEPGVMEYESPLFTSAEPELRSYMLNLPLYKGVKEIWIGLEPGAEVLPPEPYDSDQKVVFYGTSITQGGCASRPGMSYTNILSRRINLEFINLGFSGNGKGEPELARLCADIADPACLVLDYEGNADSTEHYCSTLPVFVDIYRKQHPDVPIIVISRIAYGREPFEPEAYEQRMKRKNFQRELVRKLKEAGDRHITFFDGEVLLPEPGEATVDGVHPTDAGFIQMADGIEPVLRKVLAGDLQAE